MNERDLETLLGRFNRRAAMWRRLMRAVATIGTLLVAGSASAFLFGAAVSRA